MLQMFSFAGQSHSQWTKWEQLFRTALKKPTGSYLSNRQTGIEKEAEVVSNPQAVLTTQYLDCLPDILTTVT